MSLMAMLFEAGFERQEKLSEEEAQAVLDDARAQGEVPTPAPEHLETRFEAVEGSGGIFHANEGSASNVTVFYLHGGAYKVDFSPFHWRFIRRLVDRTEAYVMAPAYRLLPHATWREAFDLIVPAYADHVARHPERKIVLMGDSAGGGLSLAIAQHLKLEGIRLPDEIILLSPWVDVTMENPAAAAFASQDPWLSIPSLRVCGRSWAGREDPHDFHVSPVYGDLSGISNVTAFTGTKEVLLPDLLRAYALLDQDGTNELLVTDGMMHVFPLMPIPEAKEARRIIYERVMR